MAAKHIVNVANEVLDWVLGTGSPTRPNAAPCEVALSTATITPGTGAGLAEPGDAGYARDTGVTFGAGSAGQASNLAELSFGVAVTGYDVEDVAIFANNGTTLLYSGPVVSAPVTIAAGETPKFAIGALDVNET
jgi:hypothetical protein